MKRFLLSISMIALMTFFSANAQAQLKTPSASPASMLKQTVGLTDVTVEYSRPSVKNRAVFTADGLVPFGKVWRTGANSATKITFSDDVKINGTELKKGSYAILTTPSATSWAVSFYPHESSNWSSYVDKTPAATVTATVAPLPFSVESFLISMDAITNTSADLEFIWDKVVATLNLTTNADETVMASINKIMAGPSADDYYAAGSYYFDSGKDMNKALEWIQKATSMGEPKFWQLRKESLVLAALKKYPEAIATAKKSLELATTAGNNDYIKMNNDSISSWMKM